MRLRPVLGRPLTRRAPRQSNRPAKRTPRLRLNTLEDRTVPSTIVWTNRGGPGSDTDNFQATYGSLAAAQGARVIVDRAIQDWEEVIANFNYAGGGNSYSLTINAGDQGDGGRGVTTGIATDGAGKPTSATITMDDDGGGAGWYFDPVPADDAEFTTLLNAFAANGPNSLNGNDFYRTIVHEMGHAMGIAIGGGLAINSFLTDTGVADPVSQDDGAPPENLFLFQGASVTSSLTAVGGGHIYEGPAPGALPNFPTAPFDLLNAGRTVGFPPPTRELISDLDARILADAYGYTVQLPSTINTFFANLNVTTGALTVNGAPGTSNDTIFVDADGGVRVQVNGTSETLAGAAVTSINVLAGGGNDAVTIATGVGAPTTVNGDSGNDTLVGGDVTLLGGPGDDYLYGSNGSDSLDGGAGNDIIYGLDGDDVISGGADNDQIYAGSGNNTVTDGSGNDYVDLSDNAVAVTYTTGGGNDTVLGTAFNDVLNGGSGADRLEGRGGNDTIDGNGGADQMFGGDGSDTLVWDPGDGSDLVEGEDGLDVLTFNGSGGAEVFTLSAVGPRLELTRDLGGITMDVAGVERVNLNALGGADSATVNDLTPTEVQVVNVNVGAGDAGDAVTVNGRTTADNLLATAVGGTVKVVGLGYDVNVTAATTADTLTVSGNDGNDSIKVETGVEAAIGVVLNGGNGNDFLSADATLNGDADNDTLVGGAGADALNGGAGDDLLDGRGGSNALDGGAGIDTILVGGTAGPDTIATTHGAGTFDITGGLSAGTNTITAVEAVRVEAGDGADRITLNLLDDGGLNYTVLGGNPIGTLGGDSLTVNSTKTMTVTAGPENDAGSVDAATTTPTNVSFDEIELLIIGGGGGGVINGTNGDDAITVIARDASFNPAADGVQDFTAVVNAGLEVLYLNQPTLTVNALGGSDTIVIRTPAPNNAVWDVDVTVDGGPPSAGTPAGSDRLVVETPGTGAETAVYTPSAADAGTLNLTTLSSLVTMTQMEELLYDGEADNDTLTIAGTAGPNTFFVTPGAAPDAGTLAMDGTLPISFQNLGAGATLNVAGNGGANTLVYYGTAANDTFLINSGGGGGVVTLNNRLPVTATGVATFRAEGYGGDDTFTLVPAISASPFATLNLNGGDQASAAGDQTNLKGTASPDAIGVSGQVVTLGGVTVASSGVENINLDSGGGVPPDVLTYTGVSGVTEAINLAGSATKGAGVLSVPGVVNLTFSRTEQFVVNGQPEDVDTLTFVGTNAVDRFNINLAAAGTAGDPVLKFLSAAGNLLLTLLNYNGFNILNVNALDGNDVVNVYTAATGPSRNVFVDGGLPTGKNKGTDVLNVYYAGRRPRIVHSATTQSPDDGLNTLDYGTAFFSVQYGSMEVVNILKS